MAVRTTHDQNGNSIYFITFTCYQWLHLFEMTNGYDTVYKWFDALHDRNIRVNGYVIMPNHIHVMLYFPVMSKSLNIIIANAKRFMAYEIINRLQSQDRKRILNTLEAGVGASEKSKGQLHKVFQDSFDAKECYSDKFIFQKLDYIHRNPVAGKWQLVKDFTQYLHSSAAFYEFGKKNYDNLLHIGEVM